MTDTEITKLERNFAKWNGKAPLVILPTIFVSIVALQLVIIYQNSLPPIMFLAPLLPVLAVTFVLKAANRWERSTRQAIATHYGEKFLKTKWRTVADAEGVAIGVSTFGNSLTLAFGSGVTETYDRSLLSPVE
jgi:hypothetical protein